MNTNFFEQLDAFDDGLDDALELQPCEPPSHEPEKEAYLLGYSQGIEDFNTLAYPEYIAPTPK